MTEPIVSVIIPVYHPKKEYIDRLLDSVVRQTIDIEQLEIIMVSDGDETESTKSILAEWEAKFPDHIMLIYYSENQGPGYARTLGMEYATGKYIAFVDQDDWISLEMYRVLVEAAERENCEIAGGFSTRDREYVRPEAGVRVRTGSEDVIWDIQDTSQRKEFLVKRQMGGYWCSIYRKEFLEKNDIYFPSGVTYDDNFFGKLCMYYVTRVAVLGEYFYHWFVNEQSISMVTDGTTHFDRLKVELLSLQALKGRGFWENYHDEIELSFIEMYYINTMHTFFWHLQTIPYQTYLKMCQQIKKEFPNYRSNPYFSSELEQYACYSWSYYPYVYSYYCDQGNAERVQLLEGMPDKIKEASWLDTIDGDFTEEELTWYKILQMLISQL